MFCQPSHTAVCLCKLVSISPFGKEGGGGGESGAHCRILEKKSYIVNTAIHHAACSVRNALLLTRKSILSYGKETNVITKYC